jgi:hypothetical protein
MQTVSFWATLALLTSLHDAKTQNIIIIITFRLCYYLQATE